MKKQVFLLTIISMAILFASMNSYGQYDNSLSSAPPTCLTPTTLTCFGTATALHPAPGESYTYTITSTDYAGSGNEKVHWFVVNNADLAATGIINATADMSHIAALIDQADGSEYLLTADGAYNVPVTDATPNTSDAVTLSWNYFDGQTQVILLVAYVYDAANCTDNIEVYRIFPEFQFTLDIASLDQDDNTLHDNTDPADECVSPIESASYAPLGSGSDDNGDGTLTVDYGENWVYFVVNAANFVDSWMPTFQFDYDGAGTIASADWTYYNAATITSGWHSINITTGVTDYVVGGGGAAAADGTSLNAQGDGTAVGAAGECIVVRVQVDHGTGAENVVTRRVTARVNGIMYDAAAADYSNTSLADFGEDGADADSLCDQVDFDDENYVDITPRPNVNESDPTPFEQKTGEDL